MTSHPPSDRPSVPPTGPPSGPLSGPGARPGQTAGPPPPPGPPYGGSGGGSGGPGGTSGGGGGAGKGGGGGPWWRSAPRVAAITAALVAAIVLIVVLTRPGGNGGGGGSAGGEVFLQNASATGPNPFTKSTARAPDAAESPAPLPSPSGSVDPNATRSVTGSAAGLYGGTRRTASCDIERQVRFLADEPAKNAAFASVLGLRAEEVPGYLRGLTPLQLRVDTRVTNHGFRGGAPTSYQAVLQAGTAVLVDEHGVPRVRCACGNPLTPPVAQKSPKTTGTAWPGYQPSQVVVVTPAVTPVKVFVVYDPEDNGWFAREPGDTGKKDKETFPPTVSPTPTATETVTDSPSPDSPSPPSPPSSPATETSEPQSPKSPPSEPATDGTETGPTTPDGTTPDGTTNGTTPDGTTPDGTTPDGTTSGPADRP
ncbi:DUF6777 domain-containing protein [Streptomyces sp. NPDC015346]|uniref:DUF6777 domain-containing protein n=1 Tax=Streptomyces sp. NPDC015346 TaxID=3364954 RepID=UPI0036FE0E9D